MNTLAKVKNRLKQNFIVQMMGDVLEILPRIVQSIDVENLNINEAIKQTIKDIPDQSGHWEKVGKVLEYQQESQDEQAKTQLTYDSSEDNQYHTIPNKLNDIGATVSEEQAKRELVKNQEPETQSR